MQKIRTRVTALEANNQCGFRHKYEQKEWGNYAEFGNIIHTAHQDRKLADIMLQNSTLEMDDKLKATNIMDELVPKTLEKIKPFNPVFEHTLKFKKKYDMMGDEYELNVEGHADCIYYDDIWTITDFKTAAKVWGDEYANSTLQKKIYPYFFMKAYGIDKVAFEYLLYIKSTMPYTHRFKYVYTLKDIEDELTKVMDNYVYSYLSDDWQAKENMRCWGCKLKKEGKCPLYKTEIL